MKRLLNAKQWGALPLGLNVHSFQILENGTMGVTGLERADVSICEINDLAKTDSPRAAKSDALGGKTANSENSERIGDADLSAVIAAWPRLSPDARAAIVAMVKATGGA